MWLKTGIQELSRVARRTSLRLTRARTNKRLTKAETRLGELGWQQADFPPEVDWEIRRIRDLEHDQAILHNESADLADQIASVKKAAGETLKTLDTEIHRLEEECKGARKERDAAVSSQEEARKEMTRCEARIAEINPVIEKLAEKLREIVSGAEEFTDSLNDRVLVKEESVTLTNEREDLETELGRSAKTIREQRAVQKTAEERLADTEARLKEIRGNRQENERDLHRKIRELKAEKGRTSKGIHSLDRSKQAHYRMVGKCLADARLAPLNQPKYLDRAIALRDRIGDCEIQISDSMKATRAANQREIWTFYAILSITVLLILTVLAVLYSR